MRATSEAPAGASVDEELPNIIYSPSGSATTGLSGGSSLGLQYKGAWCTPPRVFIDYQVSLFCSLLRNLPFPSHFLVVCFQFFTTVSILCILIVIFHVLLFDYV